MSDSGPRYRRGREVAGLSIGQAAQLLDIDRDRLLKIEDGLAVPGDGEVRSMRDRYGASAEWLRGDAVAPPQSVVDMLDKSDISSHDREIVLEFASMLVGRTETMRDKVKHVRSARQTRKHECHWPGCGAQVPPAMWGCRTHWYRLPSALRSKIWAAYRPGQEETMTPSLTYLQVADAVQKWIESYLADGGKP